MLAQAVGLLVVTSACNSGSMLTDAAAAQASGSSAAPGPASPSALPALARQQPQPGEFELVGELTQGGWVRGRVPMGTVALSMDGAAIQIAADGAFFVAFDRDAGPTASLSARLADGRIVSRQIPIAPRAWNIEHIPIGPRPGAVPSEEFKRRRAAELAQINAARAQQTDAQGWRQSFVWPVSGRLSGLFGSQRIYRGTPGAYHSGLDIATGGAGTPFVAPADGVVILAAASPFTLEGNLLMIDHGMGLNSAFLHCSQLLVREGDHVRQGQVIGRIGMTGRATGPHLHWSIKWRSDRLDPLLFTGPMR